MNKINQIVMRNCALLTAFFLCWGTCGAQVAENAPKFPGSELPLAQAVDRSIIIATGVLLKTHDTCQASTEGFQGEPWWLVGQLTFSRTS